LVLNCAKVRHPGFIAHANMSQWRQDGSTCHTTMPHIETIHNSAGQTYKAILIVRNVTGIAEERGYRLYWHPIDEEGKPTGDTICPALGLATSNPFPSEDAAAAAAQRYGWGKPEYRMIRWGDLQRINYDSKRGLQHRWR
jgi:hypothetical protein